MRRGCFGIRPSWARLRASREAGYRLADDRLPRIELTIPSGTAFYGWSSARCGWPSAVKAYFWLSGVSRWSVALGAINFLYLGVGWANDTLDGLLVPPSTFAVLSILLIVQYPLACCILPGRWYLSPEERKTVSAASRELFRRKMDRYRREADSVGSAVKKGDPR